MFNRQKSTSCNDKLTKIIMPILLFRTYIFEHLMFYISASMSI